MDHKFDFKVSVSKNAQVLIAKGDFKQLSITTSSERDGANFSPTLVTLEIEIGFSDLPDSDYFFDAFPELNRDELQELAKSLENQDFNSKLHDLLEKDDDVYDTLREYKIPYPSWTL